MREREFSWLKTGFGHCQVEQANVLAFLLLWLHWDSATFPGHLLPTPTFESPSNGSNSFTPKTSGCSALIGCPGQGPEREGWALRIFRNIFLSVLAFDNICFQSTLVKRPLLFLLAVWVTYTHTYTRQPFFYSLLVQYILSNIGHTVCLHYITESLRGQLFSYLGACMW